MGHCVVVSTPNCVMATRCVDYCPTEALKVRLNGGVTWERDICICCHACEDNCFANGIEVHDTN